LRSARHYAAGDAAQEIETMAKRQQPKHEHETSIGAYQDFSGKSRDELLELHRAARARRDAAALFSDEYTHALEDIVAIEVAMNALIPVGPLPSV
jgi:hypothetical protein